MSTRSSVYIQNCRMFHLTKNKRTLNLNYTVNFSQFPDVLIIRQSDISFYIPIIFESFDAFIYQRF